MDCKVTRREFAKLAAGAGAAVAGLALAPAAMAADSAKADSAKAASAKKESSKKDASKKSDGATREFTDSLGRVVQVPEQITAVAPSGYLAQQVLMTVCPDQIVVVASKLTDDQVHFFGDKYAGLEEVGAIFGAKGTFNREAAAASGAQIVIDVGEEKQGMAEDLDNLQDQLGIPCVHVASTLATYSDCYKTLGELIGLPEVKERAEGIAEYCASAYDEISGVMADIPEDQRTSVLYLTGEDGLSVLAKGSYQANVIDMVCNNAAVVDDPSSKSNQTSMEQIANWNPEFVIFAPQSAYDAAATDPTWQTLPAITNGDYSEVPSKPFNWLNGPPSVNQVLGMQWLPRVLYADKFDDDMYETVATYYKTMYLYDLGEDEFNEVIARAVPKNQQ